MIIKGSERIHFQNEKKKVFSTFLNNGALKKLKRHGHCITILSKFESFTSLVNIRRNKGKRTSNCLYTHTMHFFKKIEKKKLSHIIA
jgi:hypothetical protein